MLKYHNLLYRPLALHIAVLFAVIYAAPVYGYEGHHDGGASTFLTTEYQFQGVASGGTLIMAGTSGRNARFFSIETQAGESAESVVNRLAEYIDENNPFEWGGFRTGQKRITAEGGILGSLVGGYMFAGTETGLGIPEPPLSVSCTYDQDKDRILVRWTNPPGGYDHISVLMNWHNYDKAGGGRAPGQSTSFVVDRKKYQHPIDISDLDVWVIGVKNGLPSNAGAIHISSKGKVQEELFGIPFKNGVAPNWKSWVTDGAAHARDLEGLVRSNLTPAKGRRYNSVKSASRKPFYQVIKTPQQGGTAGVWRKFLGLSPGHTYRITSRLNTLQMDPNNPNWLFSLHAVHDNANGTNLSAHQLTGLASLPNGSKGLDAGKVSQYAGKMTTEGKFVESSADITLPDNVTSLTVWLRHTGKDFGEVAFDWVKLEDITPTQ